MAWFFPRMCAVTYISFILFAMLVSSASNTPWVSGGLEFTISSTQQLSSLSKETIQSIESDLGLTSSNCGMAAPFSNELLNRSLSNSLGASLSQTFSLSLGTAVISSSSSFTYTWVVVSYRIEKNHLIVFVLQWRYDWTRLCLLPNTLRQGG